ncbi:hypothetical protein KLP40_04085 [Hymenobacter sp. NST-14]|uniref:hypothetical protein n=1 Tax=Hymenobacter piscis TaxID=2839984 RepID=UPI001C02F556|nr:hypothetical protein [Hymenobacter piscis]MBT9392333.1 hypothetical protein [Hymenobacter piscis]
MNQNYSLPTRCGLMRWVLPALLGAAALTSCQDNGEVQPFLGPEYYPLEVGSYRIYDVADTVWNNAQATVSRFQFREQVDTELSPDATGQVVYRVIRSRRPTATDAWRADSVFTVRVGERAITEQFNNRRTVALVFPVQEEKFWNLNAFNSQDTITALNRRYTRVGQPFSVERDGETYRYDNSVTTTNNLAEDVNACYTTVKRTTFAQGVGPVYRVSRSFVHDPGGGRPCDNTINYAGQSRSEVLIDSGK